MKKNWALFVSLLAFVALLSGIPAAHADTDTYTTSLQSGNMCSNCGPFGTVSVSTVSGHNNELSVDLTLTQGEVFASTGAGSALLFDIANNPVLSVSGLTSGFSFHQASTHADGSGNWNTYIACDVCGSGTSSPQNSGPVSFILSVASGTLASTSFVANNNNYIFASDVGVPNGSGGYYTGDVVTSGGFTVQSAVPEPESYAMMLSGLVLLGSLARKRKS